MNSSPEPNTESRAPSLKTALSAGMAAVALVPLAAAPLLPDRLTTTLVLNAGLILFLLGLIWLLDRALQPAPLRFVHVLLFLAVSQPAALIVYSITEGEPTYYISWATPSHVFGSTRVVYAQSLFFFCVCLAAIAAGLMAPRRATSWPGMLRRMPTPLHRALLFLAVSVMSLRFGLLFVRSETGSAAIYSARVFSNGFWWSAFFIGPALRLGVPGARAAVGLMCAVGAIALAGGNRSDALLPIVLAGFGYLLTGGIPRRRFVGILVSGVVLVAVGATIGEAMRQSDSAGRSGWAALDRIDRVSKDEQQIEVQSSTVIGSVAQRVLRNGTHAVITQVPEIQPFEPDGLAKLPRDFAENLLPAINLSGTTREKEPRHWILNEFGFTVNWRTAVELALIPDAWFRGGYIGVVLIGFAVGLFLQLAESFVYRNIDASPARVVMLLGVAASIPMLEGRDVAFGFRSMLIFGTQTFLMTIALEMASRRAQPDLVVQGSE